MAIEREENKKLAKRCAECVLFATHKCTQRRHLVPIIPEDKEEVFDFSQKEAWQKWLKWIYDLTKKPVEAYRWKIYPIFKTDVACSDFIAFR